MNNEWTPRDIDILRREYPVRECEEVAAIEKHYRNESESN